MKISACVIVRDEEQNVGCWLENMSKVADELVVVDTGSKDRTVELIREHGIEPHFFAWCDDFAAAKNYAISKATGDWILFLDADEYFDEHSLKIFSSVMSDYNNNKKIGAIMCRLINIDKDNMNKVIGSMLQVRIFRNSPQIFYERAVHEQLIAHKGNYTMQYCPQLLIYHTGYSSSIMKQKAMRNLPILLEEEKNTQPEEIGSIYLFLSDAYNALCEYDKMLEYAQKAVQAEVYTVGDEGHAYKSLISAMAKSGKPDNEIMQVLDEAVQRFPEDIFFCIEKGHFFYKTRNYLVAEDWFAKAILMHKQQKESILQGEKALDEAVGFLPILYGEYAAICLLQGKCHKALEFTLQGLEYHKYDVLLIQNLYKSLSEKPVVDMIQIFDCLYDRHRDGAYLAEVLLSIASGEFIAYYSSDGHDDAKMKVFLKTGNYGGAAVISRRRLRIWQHMAMAFASRMEATQDKEGVNRVLAVLPDFYKAKEKSSTGKNDDLMAVKRLLQGLND